MDYKSRKDIKIPKDCNSCIFYKYVRYWTKIYDNQGIEALKHNAFNKNWTAEEKFKIISKVFAGNLMPAVSVETCINVGTIYCWVQLYKEFGYDGLKTKKRGRPSRNKETIMIENKNNKSHIQTISESEKEELIRLRERVEYLETELAYRKKLSALIAQKKQEKQAKAKKHK